MKTSSLFFLAIFSTALATAGTYSLKLPEENEQYIVHQQDLDPSLFNPGTGGENISWIMDSLSSDRIVNVNVFSADMFNLTGNLKNSDLIIENEFVSTNNLHFGDKHYFIYKIINDGLVKVGRIDSDTISKVSYSVYFDDAEIKTTGLIYYQQNISDSWSASYTIPTNSKLVNWSDGSTDYLVDATGNLRINGKVLSNIYRIKRTKEYTESGSSVDDIQHQVVSYEWWSEDVAMPIVVMELHTASDSTEKYTLSHLDESHYVLQGIDDLSSNSLNVDVYPNPSRGQFNIKYEMSVSGSLQMTLHDVAGNEIKKLENTEMMPGTYRKDFNFDLRPGVYFVRTVVNGKSETKKLIIS